MLTTKRLLNIVMILPILFAWTACRQPHHEQSTPDSLKAKVESSKPSHPQDSEVEALSSFSQPGEVVTPAIDGNLIRVNNRLCAVSRTLMGQEMIGKFTGQVAYTGSNPKYKGKVFEFNYCCAMCQQKFPILFSKDPDSILRFHGLM